MTETFNPPRAPSISSSGETNARTLSADFGDGYSQDADDGINTLRDTWPVVIENLTFDEAQQVTDFLRAHRGTISFFWTPPDESTPRLWKCKKWSWSYPAANKKTITMTFTEAFEA